MKVVHIELPDKTREVIVLKVFRQHMLSKLVCFVHDKARTIRVPHDGRFICRVLSKNQVNRLILSASNFIPLTSRLFAYTYIDYFVGL